MNINNISNYNYNLTEKYKINFLLNLIKSQFKNKVLKILALISINCNDKQLLKYIFDDEQLSPNCNLDNNTLEIVEILGFSKGKKSKIKDINYNNNLKNVTCSICLDTFSKNDKISKLNCSHIYHSDCILKWFIKKYNCPLCRK